MARARPGRRLAKKPRSKPPSGRPHARQGRWVVGLHAAQEALRVRPQAVAEIWLRQDLPPSQVHQWEELAEAAAAPAVKMKPVKALDGLASGHQGVALRVTEDPAVDLPELLERPRACLLALDQVEDPQNLGSVLRTSWLMGLAAVAIARDRAVGLTPTVCKVASGGAEHVPLLEFGSWNTELEDFKKAGYWVFGLDEAGKSSLYQMDLPDKIIWVIGAEGRGLRKTTQSSCDELIHIPQVDSGSSYNAAVAAALCLGETHRQKGFWPKD